MCSRSTRSSRPLYAKTYHAPNDMPANFKDQIFARSVIDAMNSPPPLVGLNARVHMLRIYSGYYETMYVGVIDRYSFFLEQAQANRGTCGLQRRMLVACGI